MNPHRPIDDLSLSPLPLPFCGFLCVFFWKSTTWGIVKFTFIISVFVQLDGQTLIPCPANVIVLKNLIANREHRFRVNITTTDGERNSSSHSWFIDTKAPTATISSEQSYTNGKKVAINVTFTEACIGKGGFKCFNSSNCDVIVSGPAHVDASSLRILHPESKYSLDIILSPESIYARINIKMSNMFCTDLAGNQFTRTNGSSFVVHLEGQWKQIYGHPFHPTSWR